MRNQAIPWKQIILFCLLAFALLWVPFFGMISVTRAGSDAAVWETVLGLVGPFSPLIAAVITRTFIAREGFGDAHLRLRGVPGRYWLLALLLPFFWNAVQDLFLLWFGLADMDWAQVVNGLYRIPINLLGGLILFAGEEVGWRSYLLQKLRPLGRWQALLFSSLVWALWHAPLVILPNAHYGEQINLPGTLLASLTFVLLGFIFGWLYLESKSVWPPVLMHAYNNLITFGLFSEAWTTVTEPELWQNALMAIVPILLIWLIIFRRMGFAEEPNQFNFKPII